jgi:acyl-CoA thioester hydrolase
MTHQLSLRVYYEDTDLAGIVYYANYLKYIERGRTEFVRDRGIDQIALKHEHGMVFAVRRIEADYFLPARFQDDLIVQTDMANIGGARLIMDQRVLRADQTLFAAKVTLVALSETGRAARIPADIRHRLA